MVATIKKILAPIEEHFDETEFNAFDAYLSNHSIKVEYASYLSGNESLGFNRNDKTSTANVSLCVSKINLADYKGLS